MTRQLCSKARILSVSFLFVVVLALLIALAAPAVAQNPVPFTNQPLVPDATAPGGPGFTLTVNGAGFVSGSMVNWNGSPRDTTFVSSSKLTAAIPASDIATASTAAVTVVNPSPGGGVSNIQYLSIAMPNAGSVSFLPAVLYNSGAANPVSVAVADVNGDGKLDVVVANCDPAAVGGCGFLRDGIVGVLLGNSDGTFQPVVTYGSGGNLATAIAVADVNGDSKPDIIITHECTVTSCENRVGVSILLGNGDGTFQPAATYNSGGQQSPSVALADVNGDGKLDLLVTEETFTCIGVDCDNTGGVSILLGNGDGTFQAPVSYNSGGIGPMSVAAADVNGDGKIDLLVANCGCIFGYFLNSGSVGVLLGNGDGTFRATVSYSAGPNPWSIAVADLNGDGKPDVAVAASCWCGHDASAAVLLGKGDGTFQPPLFYDSGGADTFSIAVSDVNGDGTPDLLVASLDRNAIGVLLGNGSGTFQPVVVFDAGDYGQHFSVVAGDLNGDGKPDLIAANAESNLYGSVAVLLNNGESTGSPTKTALVSSLNPSIFGQAGTFTATVSSSAGAPPNGETITFKNGSTVLGTSPLGGGMASLTTSSLSAGTFTITASYPGDSNFAASTSPGLRQVVNSTTKSATSTTFVSSLNPSIYGQKVTWTATVTTTGPVPPTGTVGFNWSDGFRTFNIGSATLNSSGVAVLTRSNLNADPYPLTAKYQGDANNLTSTSPILNQTVLQATSAATITSFPNPSSLGQAVTFTAKITSPTVTPTGPVTFTMGKTVLASVQLSGGKATFTTSSLPLGSSVVTVTFNGSSNITKSSASVTQVVQQ